MSPKAIEQARVTHFPITTAIARLLIEHRLHFRGQRVDFLCARVRKLLRIERLGQCSGRRAGVIRRNVAVRSRRRRLRGRLRGRCATLPMRESDSKAGSSHHDHCNKYKSCPLHIRSPCEPMRTYQVIVPGHKSYHGTRACSWWRRHSCLCSDDLANQIRATPPLGSSRNRDSPRTQTTRGVFLSRRLSRELLMR